MNPADRVSGPRRPWNSRLRPVEKILPENARAHNRALVLQHLFHYGPASRADLARATALTRVTVSDLIAGLLAEDLVEELGTRLGQHLGKPAILVGMRMGAYQIVSVDLTDDAVMRGAILTLSGEFIVRRRQLIDGRRGDELVILLTQLVQSLIADATAPVIGVGIGSPGVIDDQGVVIEAPNRGWNQVALAGHLSQRLGLCVHVANDANAAALGEFTFGGAQGSGLMVVTIGEGVGAGIVVDGARLLGHGHAAGEIGHLTVAEDGAPCACGRRGCLETILAVPALRALTDAASIEERALVLHKVGRLLGTVLAPVVSALNLADLVLSGPPDLLDGSFRAATYEAIVARTMPATGQGLEVRMATLGEDVVLAGASVLVLAGQLGVS